ncbi:class I SAM-dependent methyltransferase [Oleispirillum naphthae]|uniref:class I SAM-dependent methyltransferase n=1 Tax=Oleispirillum naphthae TaxID=2838853 RepID=UPI003082464D
MQPELSPETRDALTAYLSQIYAGAFTPEAIRAHLENHIGLAFAGYTTQVIAPRLPPGARVLDIGSGFGSCVLAAREAGFDAFGIEIARFEVDFARNRLRQLRPQDEPEKVYLCGDARTLDLAPASLDAVTLWNVIEHIDDWDTVMDAAARFLKPGGLVFVICPNYMAWRDEAHYHVPWKPAFLLPRNKASAYLRSLGRDPSYFETSIFYRSNWEVLAKLRQLGFEALELGALHSRRIALSRIPAMLRHPLKHLDFYNPFRRSVELAARKPVK